MFALMGLGVISFLLAAKTAVAQTPPHWLVKAAGKITQYFHINLGQLALILFAPCFSLLALIAAGERLGARHWVVSLTAFVLSIVLVIIGFYSLRTDGEETEQVDINRFDLLFPLVLFAAALLLPVSGG